MTPTRQYCVNCGTVAEYVTAWFESIGAHRAHWSANPNNATHCLDCAKGRAEVLNEKKADFTPDNIIDWNTGGTK